MALTFFAPGLNLMCQILKSYDIDADAILHEAGINPAVLSDFNARVFIAQRTKFHQLAFEAIPNPNFALEAGQYWHPTQLGALGYAWMTSSTLRSAFDRLARYARIVIGTANLTIEESKEGLSLNIDFANESYVPRFRIDGSLAVILAMIRCNAGQDFNPQSISFRHDAPENSADFEALFQCPVIFGSEIDGLTISIEDADKPRASSNTQLAQLHDQLLIEYVAKLDKGNVVEKVKLAVINQLGSGYISDAIIAETLFMSERTLQRRLQENKTTFKILVNKVRLDLADKYLRDSSLSLTEIAYMLGFSEMSAFSRAFKRWSGQSPSDYRVAH